MLQRARGGGSNSVKRKRMIRTALYTPQRARSLLLKPRSVFADLGVFGIGCIGHRDDRPRELCGVCREDDRRGLTRGRRYE